ncbi:MAG TPA: DUF4173 domain-containing protein [Aggregatilineales bacterium]|nr:DUF4173 domain-containing protein [Aggregatilineales bacterium]
MRDHGDSVRVIGLGILLGIIGTLLTYNRMPGLGFTVYGLLLLGALLLAARWQNIIPKRRSLFLFAPVLFFIVSLSLRADLMLALINLCAGSLAVLLLIYFFANDNALNQNLIDYGDKAILSAVGVMIQPVAEVLNARDWLASHRGSWGTVLPYVRGGLIAIPVVGVFIILFASADAVFSDLVSRVLRALTPNDTIDLIGNTGMAAGLAWLSIGGLAYAAVDRKLKRRKGAVPVPVIEESPVAPTPPIRLGYIETVIVAGSVCLLFAAFVIIQFVYLFGGARNIGEFSYADYVHRGFLELIIVAILTLGLSYVLNVLAIRRTVTQRHVLRILLSVLITLTGVILVSAFQRLRLYEEAYGFTVLRLLVYVFIVWLGVLLAGFAVSLYWNPPDVDLFGLTSLCAVFGFAAMLTIINPDAFVAQEMIAHHNVDPLYLISLSDEVIPSMTTLVDAPENGLREMVRGDLANRYTRLSQAGDWRDFSLGQANALAALATVKDELTTSASTAYGYTAFRHPMLPLTRSDFSFLRRGTPYREILRQVGEPSLQYLEGTSREANTSNLQLAYKLTDGRSIFISVDYTIGVASACYGTSETECSTLPLGN